MGRGWRPLLVGGIVAAATFALAEAQVFAPSAAPVQLASGDPVRGKVVFAKVCSTCHGPQAEGGVGPRLAGAGLDAATVSAAVQQGRGVMPAGLVSGQEQADVVAYVVSVSSPGG